MAMTPSATLKINRRHIMNQLKPLRCDVQSENYAAVSDQVATAITVSIEHSRRSKRQALPWPHGSFDTVKAQCLAILRNNSLDEATELLVQFRLEQCFPEVTQ